MAIDGLGRTFNLHTSATTSNARFNLESATGMGFVLIGATSGNATVQEHNAASGGTSQNLAVITTYWRQNAGVWAQVTQAAAATFTAGTGGLAYCWIPATSLSDDFKYISASHASGNFVYVAHDLAVQRIPSNLKAVTS